MNTNLRLITYNIDGLPEELDLSTLPLILRPIAWIYKLIKGTTIIRINDNTNTENKIKHISKCLLNSNADVIAVQEDFNYHQELMSELNDTYHDSIHTGKIELNNLFQKTEWLTLFPLPRFKCDGLNVICKKNRVFTNAEYVISWDKSCGYFKHANDSLTHKGFRCSSLVIDRNTPIDVYNIHMDADFYADLKDGKAPIDIKARESQLKQLTEYIIYRCGMGFNNPIIILGDTNSSVDFEWDRNNIETNLLNPINNDVPNLSIEEIIPTNIRDVDRIFVVNNSKSNYEIKVVNCFYDTSFNDEIGPVSDHKPLLTDIEIIEK